MSGPLPAAFEFKDCALIALAVGRSAHDLRELRDRVAEVPVASLRHHFFETFLRPTFDDPELGNDFALWARDALRDEPLAERLAVIDPFAARDGEELRAQILETIDERSFELDVSAGPVPRGRELHFLRSQIVVFETGLVARDPGELTALVPELPPGSVFYHFVDARLRPPVGEDDFSSWLGRWPEIGEAARERLAAVDPSFGSLAELRRRIAAALGAGQGARA